jgi:hypothetical protein
VPVDANRADAERSTASSIDAADGGADRGPAGSFRQSFLTAQGVRLRRPIKAARAYWP